MEFVGVREPPRVLGPWRRELVHVLNLAGIWSSRRRTTVQVNSLNDHLHMDGSLHYSGLAVDLDTAGDSYSHLLDLHGFLAKNLAGGYDTIFERDHIHVEFDDTDGDEGRSTPPHDIAN